MRFYGAEQCFHASRMALALNQRDKPIDVIKNQIGFLVCIQ
jgi:hypothetical protein